MGLILLEALGALVLLVGIVWWTMFSGRKGGEIKTKVPDAAPLAEAAPPLPPSAAAAAAPSAAAAAAVQPSAAPSPPPSPPNL